MRLLVGVAIVVAAGTAVACLAIGVGGGSVCDAGSASFACAAGPMHSIGHVLGVAAAPGLAVGGLFAVSILWQVRRHRQLAMLLHQAASPARLADHRVGLVPGLAAPCVAGLVRPRIYCPQDLAERLSDGELRAVVLHERHHQLTHAPARLVVIAALAPVVGRLEAGRRWAERRRAAIEIAADDHALEIGAGRPELAHALLKLGSASLDAGLPGYASASELRLRHLLEATGPTSQELGSLASIIVALGALVACLSGGIIT